MHYLLHSRSTEIVNFFEIYKYSQKFGLLTCEFIYYAIQSSCFDLLSEQIQIQILNPTAKPILRDLMPIHIANSIF
jgi:hypothetical protein